MHTYPDGSECCAYKISRYRLSWPVPRHTPFPFPSSPWVSSDKANRRLRRALVAFASPLEDLIRLSSTLVVLPRLARARVVGTILIPCPNLNIHAARSLRAYKNSKPRPVLFFLARQSPSYLLCISCVCVRVEAISSDSHHLLSPISSSPNAIMSGSGSGGFYKYRCKYFYTHNCSNWVYVSNSPCATCLVRILLAHSTQSLSVDGCSHILSGADKFTNRAKEETKTSCHHSPKLRHGARQCGRFMYHSCKTASCNTR